MPNRFRLSLRLVPILAIARALAVLLNKSTLRVRTARGVAEERTACAARAALRDS
jgi:hypothetical protein